MKIDKVYRRSNRLLIENSLFHVLPALYSDGFMEYNIY